MLSLAWVAIASADAGTTAVNLVPSGGKHRGIVLKSQTVDVVVDEEDGAMRADTQVWLRLQNPASKPITVTVELPGPQLAPAPLPSPLDVRVNDVPMSLVLTSPSDGSQPQVATGAIGVPARGAIEVTLSYRQDLPNDQGLVTYAYPLSGADLWAGTPESLRVTVEMKSPSIARSILLVTPPPHRSGEQSLTWDWESEWAKSKPGIGLAFMSPGWFSEFETTRASAAAEGATASEHMSLSEHYRRLASLQAPTFADPMLFRTRYYPAAVAELQAAVATSTSTSEGQEAHFRLAELYLEEADHADAEGESHYLQAAGAEVELASDPASSQPALAALAGKILDHLTQDTEAPGDVAGGQGLRRGLEAIRAPLNAPAGGEEPAATALSQAIAAVSQGDTRAAREALGRALVAGEASSATSPPIVSQTALTVTTTPLGRTIAVVLGRGEDAAVASELANRIAADLRQHASSSVAAHGNAVTITLAMPPGAPMLELQRALAADLPTEPALALLGAVLGDESGSASTQSDWLKSTWRYRAKADLSGVPNNWEELVASLDSAATNPPPGLSTTQAEQLQWVQRRIGLADAAAWRDFTANSSVTYRFEDSNSGTTREWLLRAGESKEMSFEQSSWNSVNARWAILFVASILAGLAVLVWHRG